MEKNKNSVHLGLGSTEGAVVIEVMHCYAGLRVFGTWYTLFCVSLKLNVAM